MSNDKYIIPTKKSPVFAAMCDHFGYIERGLYKEADIHNSILSVFATSFADGVASLHEYLISDDGKWVVETYPKAKFELYAYDGTVDKYGDAKSVRVYSISASKAKKYITS